MRRRFTSNALLLLVPAAIGAIFALVGGIFLWVSFTAGDDANRLTMLPLLTAVSLEDSRPEREVLVEGSISHRTQPRYQNLVAYTYAERQSYRDSDGERRYRWVTLETQTPPLDIETSSGRIRIELAARSDYELYNPTMTLQEGDYRYQGFQAGDRVVIQGITHQGPEGIILDASVVAGGDRDAYITSQQAEAHSLFWFSLGFVTLGLVLILLGLVLWWRFASFRRTEKSREERTHLTFAINTRMEGWYGHDENVFWYTHGTCYRAGSLAHPAAASHWNGVSRTTLLSRSSTGDYRLY
ncbi:MAG: hypothetical protein HC837_15565 [Chloroflexaceae bacterium]|nr:hypothetical protein [Chloroflexaceae bacterium]